jgi:putative membrane protein insertion efficiency factor
MKTLIDLIIRGYQILISPLLGPKCRFYPSCSQYARECFKKFSFSKALWYSSRRICKCHPFHPGGVDPVP